VIKEAIEEDLVEGYREMDAREIQKLDEVTIQLMTCFNIIINDRKRKDVKTTSHLSRVLDS
jgi:hypothetical protein